jgi:hypothetical protein
MSLFKKDAPQDLKDTILGIEQRADECYQLLRLLKRPANEARWALLTAMALVLENSQQKFGANTSKHDIAMVKLDRCTCGFKFISEHGRIASRLVKNFTWHGPLVEDANHALQVIEQYTHFLNVFPMWHKNHESVELKPDGRVRFFMPRDNARQRQVVAFQQGYRPKGVDIVLPYRGNPTTESQQAMRLLGELWHQARPGGTAGKFSYKPSSALIEALRLKYQERLDENFRRADNLQLNNYSLGEFKSFYVALLILCSIHEYLCYPFDRPGQPIPVSSLVMVKPRSAWTATISDISGLPRDLCNRIISDLILDPIRIPGASMCIHPFVPLDDFTIAVAPQFPLASAVDDNVLRTFSYTFSALFSAQNTGKESVMQERIVDAASPFSISHSIELPDKSTEIDLLISDEASSTVVFAELKWSRKPNRSLELIERDREIAKGITQLELIRDYARKNPTFLCDRGKLPRPLNSYANVHFLLVVWDHWYWVEPSDGIAIVNLGVLLPALRKYSSLQSVVAELLKYEWLPADGRDFHVRYAVSSANGASFESPIFCPAD